MRDEKTGRVFERAILNICQYITAGAPDKATKPASISEEKEEEEEEEEETKVGDMIIWEDDSGF